MTTHPELKNCPFCGGEGKIRTSGSYRSSHWYNAYCLRCNTQGRQFQAPQDAAAAWNTRPEACMKEDRTGEECPANKVLEDADTREDSAFSVNPRCHAPDVLADRLTSSTSLPVIDDGLREAVERIVICDGKYMIADNDHDVLARYIISHASEKKVVEVTVSQMMEYFDHDEHKGIENYLKIWARNYPNGIKIVEGGEK